ncbi:hypothetical protein ASF01_05810 [Stenotrophomonas sp. Leaf70]|nr:hypothetical protein ASF01_05810 [Stenotrophomonas sp. Leaf70]
MVDELNVEPAFGFRRTIAFGIGFTFLGYPCNQSVIHDEGLGIGRCREGAQNLIAFATRQENVTGVGDGLFPLSRCQ